MKPLVIYHANCTDGFGAAFAAWMKLGDEAEYVPMQYGDVKNVADMNSVLAKAGIPDGEGEVYILDFSLPKDVMKWLFSEVKLVVWRDHHASAFKDHGFTPNAPDEPPIEPLTKHNVLLDNNKSGALLAWEYFHPGTEVPMLIQHIDDRDRWQWKIEGSAEIHAALSSMKPWSFEQWRSFLLQRTVVTLADRTRYQHDEELLLDAVYTQGTAILLAQKQHVERMAKQARKCVIDLCETNFFEGRIIGDDDETYANGLAVNASLHQSEVGHELANQSGTYGLVWYVAADCRVRCSLRSNGDYDVSSIARSFGGGGHRNAAGFETDIETLMGWLK